MNKGLVLSIATFVAAVGLSLWGPIDDTQAGHRCGGRARCRGRCDGYSGCHGGGGYCGGGSVMPGCHHGGTYHDDAIYGNPADAPLPPAAPSADVEANAAPDLSESPSDSTPAAPPAPAAPAAESSTTQTPPPPAPPAP
jgi:hypothetical protein